MSLLIPTNALVAEAWMSQRVPGITPDMVAMNLPRDPKVWAATGFIQLTIVPGSPNVDVPIRKPIIQADCYAATLDATGTVSRKKPYHRANALAELVRTATELDTARYSTPVVMKAGYAGAIVLSVYPLTEPVEIPDDPAGYARITLDLALDWARA